MTHELSYLALLEAFYVGPELKVVSKSDFMPDAMLLEISSGFSNRIASKYNFITAETNAGIIVYYDTNKAPELLNSDVKYRYLGEKPKVYNFNTLGSENMDIVLNRMKVIPHNTLSDDGITTLSEIIRDKVSTTIIID